MIGKMDVSAELVKGAGVGALSCEKRTPGYRKKQVERNGSEQEALSGTVT